MLFENGDTVKANQLLADWDPYTLPIIAEKDGYVKYVDLKQGISFKETMDDTTGISNKVISDWSQSTKTKSLKPSINLVDTSGNVITFENGNSVNYPMSIHTILSVEDGDQVKLGQVIARIPIESSRTRDITGGLPRVAELFEARKAKDSAIIAENDGKVLFGKELRGKQKVSIVSESGETSNYLIPKGKHINFNQGETIKKGEYLLDGSPAPHDILRILGVEALTDYFGEYQTLAVEMPLMEAIDGEEEHKFKGFIDAIVATPDGKVHIFDWKTCGWGWHPKKKGDKMVTYQLTLYKHFFAQKMNIDPNTIEKKCLFI